MKISEFAVRRGVTTTMITLSVLVLGVVSLSRLPLEQLPAISSSGITVTGFYPSSSPEEVERHITLPLEETLGTLGNTERISSTSSSDRSSVRVDFKAGTDMDVANMEVRERVDMARRLLPPDLERIQIRRWQSDQRPIVYASMAWRGEGDRLYDIALKVVEPGLLRLDGVVNVSVGGMEEKQLIVELDQERLQAHNVDMPALAWQVRNNNVNLSLGRVLDADQRYLVRALGEFGEVDEIGRLPLIGRDLRLEDLGEVVYDYPEKKRFERLNGADAVTLNVYKAATAGVVEVAAAARSALEEIEAEYGGNLDIEIVRDRAESVLREVNNLTDAAFLGALLAIGIIYLFLRNIRSTLVIAVAIPISVLCVFVGMYLAREFFGSTITLNMVSMMGLMLAVGMLVDPAVVTLESIFRKREEEGLPPGEAALEGSREIGMAVLASGLTTMCVFIPFFFLAGGRMTTWMRDAGMTICLAITVSMLVALSVIPLVASRLFKSKYRPLDPWLRGAVLMLVLAFAAWKLYSAGWELAGSWAKAWLDRLSASMAGMEWTTGLTLGAVLLLAVMAGRFLRRQGMRASYARLLNWTLDHRWVPLLATVALLVTGIYLFRQIEQRGTPWTPERRVDITVEADRSYSLQEVKGIFEEMEKAVLENKEEVDAESLSTSFGQRGGSLTVRLVDADDGNLSTMEASRAIRNLLPEKVGINYKMGRQRSWSGPLLGVEVELKGPDPEVLALLAEEVKVQLRSLPGVLEVDSSLEDSEEEILVEVDREQALGYGLSPREVATSLATALGTRRTSSYKAEEREIPIVLQWEEEDRSNLEQLKNSRLTGRDNATFQLAGLADFQQREGPKDLKREDRQHNVVVFANTESRGRAFRLMGPVREKMKEVTLPPGYSWDLGRAARWAQQDTQENTFTLLFALLLIYLIMASLFESLIHPFTIMLAIPFSLIGVFVGLYVLEIPLDFNGILGLLILFGIVVNNGIVMIDHINHFRREGMERRQAILRGGQNRLRPILMTAFTTILNLMPLVLPMIYGTSEGFARRWGPVGLVVVCGLASSTVLTLVLAPTLYSLLDDLALWMRRVARAATIH